MLPFIKFVPPAAYDWGLQAQIVPVSRRGVVGTDLTTFVKRAGHGFVDALRRLDRRPGEDLIHLIAIGATEGFGANRNGDGFKVAACRKYHPTFVSTARFYRDHLNRNPEKSYGVVKLSMFNEEMKRIELIVALNATKEAAARNGGLVADRELDKLASGADVGVSMACPRVGTLVKLERGWKPVEDVVPGDRVLTHRGRYRAVTARVRQQKTTYVRVGVKYSGRQQLEFTPEHEFYAARWTDLLPERRRGDSAADPLGVTKAFRQKYRNQLHTCAKWRPCEKLRVGDLLLMPVSQGTGLSGLTAREARVLGYYLAEGSVTGGGYPCFTCHVDDAAVTELPRLLSESVCAIYPHSASQLAVNINVFDKSLGTKLTAAVGRGVRNKVIPQAVIDATRKVKLEFMAAWLNGDGWQDARGLHWSTCSRTLSIELQMLLASVGIPASVYRIDHTSDLPDRPRIGEGIEYTVNVSNRYAADFVELSNKVTLCPELKAKTTTFLTGGYLAVPVENLERVTETIDVCDLTVDEDESFTAFGIAVHNCRIPFDVCSGCGNRAANRGEYCHGTEEGGTCKYGGLQTRMGKVAADGHQLHADNPDPTFFDISHVFRPADRVAWVLGRVKEAGAGRVVGGAEIAEAYGSPCPPAVAALGVSKAAAAEATLAFELAALETTLVPTSLMNRSLDVRLEYDKAAAVPGSTLGAHLRALADAGVLLPPAAFFDLAAPHLKAAAAGDLTAAFRQLVAAPDFETRLTANPYRPDARTPAPAVRVWAAAKVASLGIDPWAVANRFVLQGVTYPDAPPVAPPAVKVAAAVAAPAAAYAQYQLAFVANVPAAWRAGALEAVVRSNRLRSV